MSSKYAVSIDEGFELDFVDEQPDPPGAAECYTISAEKVKHGSGVSLGRVLEVNKPAVDRDRKAEYLEEKLSTAPDVFSHPPVDTEDNAVQFTGEGFTEGVTATARNNDVFDDEFDYAFDGGSRVGERHVQVFKPKALPAHLVTNVKSAVLNAVEEDEEEEEEGEQLAMVVEDVAADEFDQVVAEQSPAGADGRGASHKYSSMQTASSIGVDEDDMGGDSSMAGQDTYGMRGPLSTDVQQDVSKPLPSGWSTFVATASQPDFQELEEGLDEGEEDCDRLQGGCEHAQAAGQQATHAPAVGHGVKLPEEELPSYRVLKALSFEENKLTAEQVESAAAVALPALPTSNHLINQYHSHLQAPLSPLSNTQSQSSVAHNSSMTGLSRATDHYDGDPSSLLGNPASAQQHNDHPSAGHVFASGNQSVPVSHLSGLSATDGSQAATAQLGNSSAAGFSISLDHWATMGASMRASQDGPLARFVAVGEMASLQGGENSSQAAVAAAAGAAAMAALTALSVGGDKGTAPAATHAHSAHLVSTSVGSLGAGPQQLRTHQAKSHSARSSPTQGPGMPSSGAAVAASRVASGAAREQGPEATDEWEEANARMHQQGQSHSSPAARPVTFHEVLLHFMSTPIDSAVRSSAEASLAPRPGLFQRLLCMGPPDLKPLLREQQVRLLSLARTSFSEQDPLHLQLLRSIYSSFTGKDIEVPRFGNHWEEVGFQGNDPATDLRSCGVLGLFQLAYLHQHDLQNAQRVYTLSCNQEHQFPLAPVSLNVTKFMLQAMRKGDLNRAANSAGSAVEVANRFYVGAMYAFYDDWVDGAKTMADSGFVIKSIEQMCQKHPAKVLELAGMELRDWRPILDV